MQTLFCLAKSDKKIRVVAGLPDYFGKLFDEVIDAGWRAISISGDHDNCWVLMEKDIDTYRK